MTLLQRAITAAALAMGASTAYAAEDVIGHIDGFISDGAGHYALRGWACVTTSNVPLSVHMYVGGPVGQPNASIVGGYEANQPSEQAVADACQATGLSYRFVISLTDDLQKSHGGQPLYVYGISTVGGPNNVLGGSGKYLVPKVAPVSTVEVLYYVHTDRLGSAVVITDATAKTVSASDYKPYGGDATKQEKPEAPGFTGHYEDPLTGLTYMQARYYDADLGVFLSADPLSSTPGNLFNFSRYGYANANPLAFIDPTGMASCSPSVTYPGADGKPTTHHTPNTSCGGGGGGSWGGNPWGGMPLGSPAGNGEGMIGHGGGGGGTPNKPTDLEGFLVKPEVAPPNVVWHGTVWAATVGRVGISAGRYVFTLTSDCVDGTQQLARISAIAFGGGAGAVVSNTGSFVTFETNSPQLDPQVFVGPLVANTGGLAIGVGYGVSSYKLGYAHSRRSGGVAMGFDAGAGILAGDSVLEWSNSYSCGK